MEDSKTILKQYWGYDDFRHPQEQIIAAILSKKDTVALLPTGGGKSICFQIPALMLPGKTLVISPLIALMQDQVDQLFARGIIAKSLNAHMRYREIDAILDSFVYGDLKLLYVSPERLRSELFMTRIAKSPLSLIAVDEAHCISQWGYDFRPAYFDIPKLREIHPHVPIVALTATATKKVLEDISVRLEMKNEVVFQKSFARDNLGLIVIHTEDKRRELLQILSRVKGCGIIYVRNRKETIDISLWLSQHGVVCATYHGGMDKSQREKNQLLWVTNRVRMIISTNAFGMGIDKSDVRLVIHLDIAPSLEEYYQEAGRAGRDGQEAYAISLIDDGDFAAANTHFSDQFPSIEIITSVYDRLCRYHKVAYGSGQLESYDFNLMAFAEYVSLSAKKVYHILNVLEKEGWIAFSDAFKEPSRVMMLADQEALEIMHRTPSLNTKIIIHLLRKYEGLFIDPVKVDETRIAKELKIEQIQLVHHLNILKSEGVIAYYPRASEPQITFMMPRPTIDDFYIDKKSYLQRKKMAEDRLRAVISYMNDDGVCRQKSIIEYFGQKGKDCGTCDVCLGASVNTITEEQLTKIYTHLQEVVSNAPINIKLYVSIYPFNKRKRILRALKEFASEGLIYINDSGYITMAKV
ncbi:MAG: ATP-dependent DNA helicase RecQ [Saprospiraceae bacterium]